MGGERRVLALRRADIGGSPEYREADIATKGQVIEIGPRGGKIVGYRFENGKRMAVYEGHEAEGQGRIWQHHEEHGVHATPSPGGGHYTLHPVTEGSNQHVAGFLPPGGRAEQYIHADGLRRTSSRSHASREEALAAIEKHAARAASGEAKPYSQPGREVEIQSAKNYGGPNPWAARVTGRDKKYGFAQEFLRASDRSMSRSGRTGTATYHAEHEGLYRTSDGNFVAAVKEGSGLRSIPVDSKDAREIARQLDDGKNLHDALESLHHLVPRGLREALDRPTAPAAKLSEQIAERTGEPAAAPAAMEATEAPQQTAGAKVVSLAERRSPAGDKPEEGKTYAITGPGSLASGAKTWADAEVSQERPAAKPEAPAPTPAPPTGAPPSPAVAKLEAQTAGKPEADRFGKPYGGGWTTPDGKLLMMRRKGQRVRFFDEAGTQVGPEHMNVAPAVAWGIAQGFKDAGAGPAMGPIGGAHAREMADRRRDVQGGGTGAPRPAAPAPKPGISQTLARQIAERRPTLELGAQQTDLAGPPSRKTHVSAAIQQAADGIDKRIGALERISAKTGEWSSREALNRYINEAKRGIVELKGLMRRAESEGAHGGNLGTRLLTLQTNLRHAEQHLDDARYRTAKPASDSLPLFRGEPKPNRVKPQGGQGSLFGEQGGTDPRQRNLF